MNVVLIVEDEILEREFLTIAIREELSPDDMLLVCDRGDEAIKLAKQYRPNIIFMDLMIPEVDGLTAIQEIRKFLPNTCISILTAYSEFAYAQKAISLRVFEYLLKPVKPKDIKKLFLAMNESAAVITAEPKLNSVKKTVETTVSQSYFIEQATNYIKDHFKEKLTLETVAAEVFVNPKYFSHVFKREMGVSFTDYIIHLRVQYACRLLETTNYKAYRISSECGFSDPSYFNRVFNKEMEMTPQMYRKYAHTLNQNSSTFQEAY